jgi:predicted MFS family arabinose efflux permease
MLNWSQLRVLALFSLGYFVSYVFRGVNLGFSPYLIHDLGLSAASLGVLTSLYFLGFAATQIPAGVMLDHFGARRTVAVLLLVTAAGSVIYGQAHALAALMAGRFLIGVGVAACLGGAFKALAQVFALQRLPMMNGIVMAVGGLGGVAVGSPLSWLLSFTDWRSICGGLAALSALTAAALWLGAPRDTNTRHQGTLLAQFKGTWHILCNPGFWKVASFSVISQGTFYAMQSLWLGAYLRDVTRMSTPRAAAMVSVVGVAMMAGCLFFGFVARSLERFGLNLYRVCGIGMLAFLLTQILLVLQVPLPDSVLWAAYGVFGGTGILTYAIMAEHFPAQMIGRVNTTLTLVIFVLIFVFQIAVGAVLSHWPRVDGHYPVVAHLSAWGALIALQLAGAVWYFLPAGQKRVVFH